MFSLLERSRLDEPVKPSLATVRLLKLYLECSEVAGSLEGIVAHHVCLLVCLFVCLLVCLSVAHYVTFHIRPNILGRKRNYKKLWLNGGSFHAGLVKVFYINISFLLLPTPSRSSLARSAI